MEEFAVQNPFIAKVNVNHLIKSIPLLNLRKTSVGRVEKEKTFQRIHPYEIRDVLKLDNDYRKAIEKSSKLKRYWKTSRP